MKAVLGKERERGCPDAAPSRVHCNKNNFYLFSMPDFHIKHPLKKNALQLDIHIVSKSLPKRYLLIARGKMVALHCRNLAFITLTSLVIRHQVPPI